MENSDRKTSSSLKVGILTVVALTILIFTVLWIKGRTLSAGERIEVVFHDVNGIRPGSGVQMMGLRIGQIEEITPEGGSRRRCAREWRGVYLHGR